MRVIFPALSHHLLPLLLQGIQALAQRCAMRNAPACRATHAAPDADVGGRPRLRIARAAALVFLDLRKLRLHQVGQRQIVKEDVEKLFSGEGEDEVVQTLALVAGLPAAPARRSAGPLHLVAHHEAVVASIDSAPHP